MTHSRYHSRSRWWRSRPLAGVTDEVLVDPAAVAQVPALQSGQSSHYGNHVVLDTVVLSMRSTGVVVASLAFRNDPLGTPSDNVILQWDLATNDVIQDHADNLWAAGHAAQPNIGTPILKPDQLVFTKTGAGSIDSGQLFVSGYFVAGGPGMPGVDSYDGTQP